MRTLPAHTRSTNPAASPRPRRTAQVPATVAGVQAGWPGHPIMDSSETAQVLHAAWSGDPATVVPSPPGAGKTRLVALLAVALTHRAGMRIGIAAQTREQAVEIARRLGTLTDRARLIWKKGEPSPGAGQCPTLIGRAIRFPNSGGGILAATTARWLFADPSLLGCDLMLVDEAWQATYADLGALGAFAAQIVCVGDPGQIAPVVPGNTDRWRTRPDAPNLPAPDALRAAHGDAVGVVALKHTWRLGPDTTALIQPAFYADLPFTSKRPPEHLTTDAGEPVPELAHTLVPAPAGAGDPHLSTACAERARALLGHTLTTTEGRRPITDQDVAVVCPHVSQAAAVRAMLADLPDVLVGTANQLQGLERPAVVALHPLAGYRDASAFNADTGRACVMLSRHRAHLTVVTDPATPDVLAATDPTTPGVTAHALLLNHLLATPATA